MLKLIKERQPRQTAYQFSNSFRLSLNLSLQAKAVISEHAINSIQNKSLFRSSFKLFPKLARVFSKFSDIKLK
jgi:hypothetical protein